MYDNKFISVTSHALDPSLCHKLSHFLGPLPLLKRDVLYGRPLIQIHAPTADSTEEESEEFYESLENTLKELPRKDKIISDDWNAKIWTDNTCAGWDYNGKTWLWNQK